MQIQLAMQGPADELDPADLQCIHTSHHPSNCAAYDNGYTGKCHTNDPSGIEPAPGLLDFLPPDFRHDGLPTGLAS